MPVFTTSSARPRQELASAIVEAEGSVQGLIGEKILPPFPINRRTAHVVKATLADTAGLRHIAGDKYLRAPGTKFERMVAKFGDDSLTVAIRGAEIVIPNEAELDLDGFLDIEQFFVSKFGNETGPLTKEYLIAAAVFNTTNFGSATNSGVAYTAANFATNSFVADVIASARRVRAKGEIPDTVVMSGPVYERIRQATLVQGFANGTLRAGMDVNLNTITAMLAEHGIKQVLVGDSYYNNAADGATASLSAIWSNTYIWVGKGGMPNAAAMTDGVGVPTLGGAGALLFWEGYGSGGKPSTDIEAKSFAGGNYVETYYQEDIDSEIVRIKMAVQPYTSGTRSGDLIATQYS
jgi:hypothetical protein